MTSLVVSLVALVISIASAAAQVHYVRVARAHYERGAQARQRTAEFASRRSA